MSNSFYYFSKTGYSLCYDLKKNLIKFSSEYKAQQGPI